MQAPGQAFASTMPEAAIRLCPGAQVMALEEIAMFLQKV